MAPLAGQKRKVVYDTPTSKLRAQKRQKSRDAREISVQTGDAALSATGELNIASFVKAREFEINALDKSMKRARKGLMSRAFQQLPRHLRRRTASHNVKKVPKRLRKRAVKEMKEDNTPTVNSRTRTPSSKLRLRLETVNAIKKLNARRKKARNKEKDEKANTSMGAGQNENVIKRIPRSKKNKLANPPRATSKYKKRQVHKTWLPTHMWHTKRAHMTRPVEPLWRMAIPLKPTEKSYRSTHRAAGSRACIAWDTSFLSTIECFGTESALESMLKAFGFHGDGWTGSSYRKWKNGTRYVEGWVSERDNAKRLIAPIIIIWQSKHESVDAGRTGQHESDPSYSKGKSRHKTKLDRRLLVRIHPSAFHQFWLELLKVAKIQKPQVLVEDLRFEIGSITIEGPSSTEALVGVLAASGDKTTTNSVWRSLASLSNPALLPLNAMLSFEVSDPRLDHPPKQMKLFGNNGVVDDLNEILVSWPPDHETVVSGLFSHKIRYLTSKAMLSQKGINRWKTALAEGTQDKAPPKSPNIPLILLASRPSRNSSSVQGSWTVLLPWSCVDAVWRSLMYYPLSSGETPKFGGLEQTRQVNFEQSNPWFPGDYPGTEAGKAWDRTETENRFDAWIRRPPSRRFTWESLDLGLGRKGEVGRGWACDWQYLFADTVGRESIIQTAKVKTLEIKQEPRKRGPRLLTQRQRKAHVAKMKEARDAQRGRNTSSPESDMNDEVNYEISYIQEPSVKGKHTFEKYSTAIPTDIPSLVTIRIRLLSRGTPMAAARIYRLPSDQQESYSANEGDSKPVSVQPRPLLFAEAEVSAQPDQTRQLRSRWLRLDPNPAADASIPKQYGKVQSNRHSLPKAPRQYPATADEEALKHIRVFPPRETRREVLDMFGPKPPAMTDSEIANNLLPVPRNIMGFSEQRGDDWTKQHVPCPDPEDLIGFVTSGGYNLAEGRGTAIGAVWCQRVIEGWKQEDEIVINESMKPGPTEDIKRQKQKQRQRDRERHLCIVRNAGESVGRLGIWEVC